jgi:SLT domain-containing protein
MTTLLGDARIRIRPDMTGVERSITGGIGGAMKKAALIAGAAFAAAGVVDFLKDSVRAASDLNETQSKANIIFGKSSKEINSWAKNSATSFGLSRQQALDAAASFGDMFLQLGFTRDQAVKTSKSTIQLAADLGSFSNVDPSDVLQRIQAAYRGEFDSLQLLIPNINAARVEQVALGLSHKKSAKELTAADKAMAVNAIVTKDGARAAGDFARTSGGLANQQRIAAAQFEDTKAKLGQALLPIMTRVMSFVTTTFIPGFEKLVGIIGPLLAKAINTAVGFISGLVKTFQSGKGEISAWGTAFSGVGSAIATFVRAILPTLQELARNVMGVVGPAIQSIGKIIREQVLPALQAFIPAVTPIVKFLVQQIGSVLVGVLKGAVNVIEGVFRVIAGILNVFTGIFTGNWKKVWEGVKQIFGGAVQAILGAVQIWLFVGLPRLMLKGAGFAFGLFRKAVVAGFNLSKTIFFGAPKFLSDGLLKLGGLLLGLAKRALTSFANYIKGGFNSLVTWIGKVPGRIASGFRSLGRLIVNAGKAGISAVSSWINNTIIDNLNKLTSLFGLKIPHIPGFSGGGTAGPNPQTAGGGRIQRAFATGGIMPGYNPGRDDALIAVGGGEAIMRPEWTRAIGADKIHAMNKAARMGGAKGVQEYLEQHEGFAGGGIFGSVWNGLKNVGGKVVDVVAGLGRSTVSALAKNILRPLVNGFKNTIGGRAGILGKLIGGILDRLMSKVESWGANQENVGGGSPGAAGGAKKWTSVILTALRMLGQPASWLATVLSRMNRESGGNPNAINLWDSNAKAGYPSQGLMQTIPQTFYAYAGALAGRGIRDPLANTYAGLNYAIHRYGSLAALNRPGGYAKGTNNARRGWAWAGENGPELIKFKGGEQVIPNGVGGNVNVQVFIGERELTDIVDVRVTNNNNRMADALRRGRR